MKLISDDEIKNPDRIYIPEGPVIEETLLRILSHKQLSKLDRKLYGKDNIFLINSLLEELELKFDIPDEDLENIQPEGSFITISNHPYRGIDTLLLYKLIYPKRNDFKIVRNYLLPGIESFDSSNLSMTDSFNPAGINSLFTDFNEAPIHIESRHCLGIFPAGASAAQFEDSHVILDREWQQSAIKFIKNANVPVIPVYFHGTQIRLQYIFRKINPLMKLTDLPSEILNKKNRIVRIRIGAPITVREQEEFKDISQYGRYLRARTYLLGSKLEVKRFFNLKPAVRKVNPEPVAAPLSGQLLREEYERIKSEYELFSTKNYSVVCAPTRVIPHLINEIGRLRELTFREVGEGTNKSTDIDEYDLYYNHLFIWDNDADRIVGSYRIGKGREIANIYGIRGFYINSLFKIRNSFLPVLKESLELGRSFIVKDYQKKAIPLFLLWKGIMVFLLRNQEYRYLIGPVSISNDFTKLSKNLIVGFVKAYFYDEKMGRAIIPKKKYVVRYDRIVDQKIFIDVADHDINKIERIIMNIEPGYRIPVLLRKYLEINGRIIGFNIDPKFNDCLDGLLILDLYKVPPDYIKGLAKEMDDDQIIERFRL
ncbi:MAG TPA: lysophospholipid acyltransferase family protein [Bacteroidales bacterium]|jgi:putative hemolysin|nr:GNAT family N-acetyltransferase [Bacteroidales bacterium]HNR42816.1 lysophospholipid acyltransferase family protein [Bacteroidales bacterium]HPM18118.1 lysophospholipid acyltransferase family protein [Bacteroidales bacterium]HQG77223.1 lysophospholipid acyltransferase family protein [Bacteroidales bacterium]